MASIEMNVLKVGDSEFEIADAQARQDVDQLKEDIGTLSELETSAKENLVEAINEANANGGSEVEVRNKILYIDGVPQDIKGVDVKVTNGTLYIDGVPQTIEGLDGVGISNIAKTGTSGLVDTYTIAMTDGTTYTFTVTNGDASDAKIQQFIDDWLDEHPEATTTVQDGAITMPKLSADVKSQLGTRANHNYLYNAEQAEGTGTFIELFQKVKNEVMDEYRGNIDKIPFILVTDPHGQLAGRKGIFDAINSCVNWYDISKFFNLGDVVTSFYGTFTNNTDELTTCSQLETMISVLSPIPMDKQVNVFGNHDAWCLKSGEAGYKMLPQNLLAPYFRNAQGHRMSNAGYFVVKDDYFNVKYVVVSGFEWTNGVGANTTNESASTEQISWLIKELGTDDGYDIVILTHVPLFPDWAGRSFESRYPRPATSSKTGTVNNTSRWAWLYTDDIFLARKNKTTGSFTDRSGVVHTFDYSGLTGNLLCGIDGHLHFDCSQYTGNDEFLCESFGSFKLDQGGFMYFGLIDRENDQLNIWKIHHENLYYENYQVPFSIPSTSATYTIKRRLKNTETYQISNTIREGQIFYDIVFPASGYTVGTVKVLMGGIDVTSTYYDSTTHEIRIPSVIGDIDITAYDSTTSADALVWTVTNILENANSNKPKVYGDEYYEKPIYVDNGSSYSETINAKSNGYTIYEISVNMGDTDITDDVTSSRATLTLSVAVTGDIEVNCKACPITYIQGLLDASGDVDSTQTSYGTTSYVPVDGSSYGSLTIDPSTVSTYVRIAFYTSEKTFINVITSSRSSTIYVPSDAEYMRVSMWYDTSNHNFFPKFNTDITSVSVSATASGSGITIGDYPATIRKGNKLIIPITKDDGELFVDTCTAGGSNIGYTMNDDSIIIPYTPGDIVLAVHLRREVMFELTTDTVYESIYDTGIKPAESLENSFTYMLDFDYPSNNNTGVVNTGAVYYERQISATSRLTYGSNRINIQNTPSTRLKFVLTHVGGSSSYDMVATYKFGSSAEPVTTTLTSGDGSVANKRIDTQTLKLYSGVTYHKVKVLSRIATTDEIAAFLNDW